MATEEFQEAVERVASSYSAAAAFAAMEAIRSGEWDRYLDQLQGAIRVRKLRLREPS